MTQLRTSSGSIRTLNLTENQELWQRVLTQLTESRYFKNVSEHTLRQFLLLTTYHYVPAGEEIMKQGLTNNSLFIIISGMANIHVDNKFIYRLGRSGSVLGEMSLITDKPSSATVSAHNDMELISVSKTVLDEVQSNRSHEMHYHFYKLISVILSDKLHLTSQKAKLYEDLSKQLEESQQRLQEDLQEARLVQDEAFQSNMVSIPNLEVVVRCYPMEYLCGDVYGTFKIDSTRYGILLGDVTGHGTAAALLSLSILNFFSHFSRNLYDPAQVMSLVNQLCLKAMPNNRFVTAFYGIFDVEEQTLNYTSAGHCPALVMRNGTVLILPNKDGLPLGLFEEELANYVHYPFQVEKGDRIFLMTDGVFESYNTEEVDSDFKQLVSAIESMADLSSTQIADNLYRHRLHSDDHPPDDFTLLIFEMI